MNDNVGARPFFGHMDFVTNKNEKGQKCQCAWKWMKRSSYFGFSVISYNGLNILKRVTGTVTTGADDVLYKTEKKENWRSTANTVTHVEKATG